MKDGHMQIELRDYQVAALQKVLAIYQHDPHGKAKFVWATGLGKTVGFSAIAHEIRQRTNTNVLIIAHRDELLNQAAQKYRYIDPDASIGKVGGSSHEWGHPVTVASIQTLCRPQHLKSLKRFDYGLVIVDEAHHALNSNEYGKVLAQLPNAFKLGCTATDDRLDNKTNVDLFGEPVHTVSILDAIEQGYLCNVQAIAIKTGTSLDGLHTREGDYQAKELAERIDTPERNTRIAEAYLEHASGRQAICFSVDVDHAYHLAEAFNARGIKAIAVHGNTPRYERAGILRDFESGLYRVVVNCSLYTEGYDAETIYDEDEDRYIFLSCAIMARPTKSRALFAQCIGRVLRLAPTKTDALILDATDNILNHRLEPQTLASVVGIALQDGEMVLEAQARKRRAERELREKRERTTKEGKRMRDLNINVLERLDWQRRRDGSFALEIGPFKHNIVLVPSPQRDGSYSVWASLAPKFESQQWLRDAPLGWAQQFAEKRARMLLADPQKVKLVDRNAPWRSLPVDPGGKQALYLRRFGIPITENLTRGEASDILEQKFAEKAEQRRAKKARQRGKTNELTGSAQVIA